MNGFCWDKKKQVKLNGSLFVCWTSYSFDIRTNKPIFSLDKRLLEEVKTNKTF